MSRYPLICGTLALLIVMAMGLTAHESQQITASLGLEKSEFVVGEPLVAKITLENTWPSHVALAVPFGASIWRSYELQWISPGRGWRRRHDVGPPVDAGWCDAYFLPPKIGPCAKVCAVHLLLPTRQEGNYDLKASFYRVGSRALQGRSGFSETIPLETNELRFQVRALAEEDPINGLLNSHQLREMSDWIVKTHYQAGKWRAPKGLDLDALVDQLLACHLESAFTETLLYAYVLFYTSPSRLEMNSGKAQRAGEEFLRRYPQSYLRAEVYERLFHIYYAKGEYRKAVEAAEEGIRLEESVPLYRNRAWINMRAAEAYYRLGEMQGARRWAEKVKSEYPPHYAIWKKADELLRKIEAATPTPGKEKRVSGS